MHTSIRLDTPCELINITPLNPLISKCEIKVCYVSDEPNRNNSIITKEVATEMANSLPGSPIVGFYNENIGDFEEHNRVIDISNGEFKIKDTTRPYGFVDLGAKVWFQKFLDDGVYEREYLMTEGYLWTGQYPEAERVLEHGNNQSMELDEKTINAHWTKDNKGNPQFFIINEAIISKLCILGEECEPCFEGASIGKVQFSFDNNFKEKLFTMMNEIKEILKEGGESEMTTEEVVQETVVTEEAPAVVEETVIPDSVEEASETDFAKKKEEDEEETEEKNDDTSTESTEEENDEEDDEEKKKNKDKKGKYNLEEIPEYMELSANFSELMAQYNALIQEKEKVDNENAVLTDFRKQVERKEKEEMIQSFYMLSDAEKQDVMDNIDTYSLHDIEAQLSIICVRNKVNFNLDDDNDKGTTTYNLNVNPAENDAIPAWVKAAMAIEKTLN